MPSTIDATKPIAGNPTTSSVRANFAIAKAEIEALQADVSALEAGAVPDASTTVKGIVELATSAEVNTGTDTGRAITPSGLEAWTGSTQVTEVGTITTGTWSGTTIATNKLPAASTAASGIVELADTTETNTGTSTSLAVTPAGLEAWTGSAQIVQVGTITSGTWNGSTIGAANLPVASESATGIIELATSAEVNAGVDTSRAVTPAGLAGYTAFAPKASPTFSGTASFSGATISNLGTVTTADINGGTIDGTTVGATSHTTGKFTTLQATGALTIGAEVVETVYALSTTTPALNPANGTIQTWTLTGNSTPTDSLATGESITIHILDGTAYTITWPTMKWVGGSAPTLHTTYETIVQLWKVGSTLYGAEVGTLAS